MNIYRMMQVAAFGAALTLGGAAASAQEAYYDDDGVAIEADVDDAALDDDIDDDDAVTVRRGRVYGFRAAPSNCGEFHYWNGDYCADARTEPPR